MKSNSVLPRSFSLRFVSVFVVIFAAFLASPAIAGQQRDYNGSYSGDHLSRVAFPLGGIGAGMICLEGAGALSHVSLYNQPDIHNEPCTFSAIYIKGKTIARVLEGPFPSWKLYANPRVGVGSGRRTHGLPRFAEATFNTRFPFAVIDLDDHKIPLKVRVTGWSPFVPGDADNSSLPVAALEYQFENPTNQTIEAVYSFNSKNFMADQWDGVSEITRTKNGFLLTQLENKKKPWRRGTFAAFVDDPATKVNCAWFRGGWFDFLTMAWKDVEEGNYYDKAPVTKVNQESGATIFVPFKLNPGQKKTIKLMLCWYVPESDQRRGKDTETKQTCASGSSCAPNQACAPEAPLNYKPWYSGRFKNITQVADYWRDHYTALQNKSRQFSDCFYDTTLPPEVIEAVAANLTILKSPTVLRQTDGKLWAFEGSNNDRGCCAGSCTHVWNYAQAIPHLFPDLERSLRQTEFNESQADDGMQQFRSALPIRTGVVPGYKHAAADGQLGGIMKIYRDWRISGDTEWLKNIWPKVKQSLDYCIEAWDPQHNGVLSEPHHNTYDIEFWGPDGMCSSFYLGALKAAIEIGKALGDDNPLYATLLKKGQKYVNNELYDGEYYYQKIQWKGLRTPDPTQTQTSDSKEKNSFPEVLELIKKEGPRYQYGTGCLSDGVLGSWMARVCGLEEILDEKKIASHLKSVHKYNLRKNLLEHANTQRPSYAAGNEGGLLLCSWPKGGQLSLPFIYSNEVWTGIEYQVAAHLMMHGMIEQGLEIVRICRDRYDGRVRNPFDEYECGHWYARAMSSYAMLQALSGARYDAVEKVLYLKPAIKGDFRSFLSTAFGYGTVGVKNGKPFFKVVQGDVPVERIEYSAR